jgi:hypothetical protein
MKAARTLFSGHMFRLRPRSNYKHRPLNQNFLSANPASVRVLEANPPKIDWWRLSVTPTAVHLQDANPGKSAGGRL